MSGIVARARSPNAEGSTGTGRQPSTRRPARSAACSSADTRITALLALRQEHHPNTQPPALRELEVEPFQLAGEQALRNLEEQASAVARLAIRCHGATMRNVDDRKDRFFNELVSTLAPMCARNPTPQASCSSRGS